MDVNNLPITANGRSKPMVARQLLFPLLGEQPCEQIVNNFGDGAPPEPGLDPGRRRRRRRKE